MKQSYLVFECTVCHETRKVTMAEMKTGDPTTCPNCGSKHKSIITGSFTRPSNLALST